MSIHLYQSRFNLLKASFQRNDHEDALVADVYKVLADAKEYILKICHSEHHYLREVYFLQFFADKILVPKIIQLVPP